MNKTPLSPETLEIIGRIEKGREDLIIPILQDIQKHEGYIPQDTILMIAEKMDTTPARIYGVATFYNQFRLTPLGKHVIKICRGTACHVKGSKKIMDVLLNSLGIKDGETTKDGLITVEEVACLGACSIAPAVMIDDKFYGHITSDGILQLAEALRGGAK